MATQYRSYTITYDPPPGPTDQVYSFSHEDFDGAPDSSDNRCGRGSSIRDCEEQIDELEDGDPDRLREDRDERRRLSHEN